MSGSSSEISTPSSIGHPEALIDQIQQQIHASGYDNTVQQVFCNTVNATIAISKILYPCSNILREDDRREVERIAKTLSKDVDTIGRHIDHSIAEVDRAYDTLQSWCTATSREPGTSWDRLSRGKPLPTGIEARLFNLMAELFDVAVYHPLIDLHQHEPAHNMWVLEHTFNDLSIIIQDLVHSARISDAAMTDLYNVFETLVQPDTPTCLMRSNSADSMRPSPAFPPSLMGSRSGSISVRSIRSVRSLRSVRSRAADELPKLQVTMSSPIRWLWNGKVKQQIKTQMGKFQFSHSLESLQTKARTPEDPRGRHAASKSLPVLSIVTGQM